MPVLTPKGHYVIGKCEAEHENKGKKFEKNDGGGVWFKCGKPLGNGKFCDAPFTPVDGEPLCDRDGNQVGASESGEGQGPVPNVGETGVTQSHRSGTHMEAPSEAPPAPTTDLSLNEHIIEDLKFFSSVAESQRESWEQLATWVKGQSEVWDALYKRLDELIDRVIQEGS